MEGMTDLQFKDHLRELIANLERIKRLSTDEEMRKELEELIKRKKRALED